MMKQDKVKFIAEKLIEFIIKDATNNRYGLVATKFFHPKEKKWTQQIAEFDDIGDYLTFIAWAGKIFKQSKFSSFVSQQINIWKQLAGQSDLYPESIDCLKPLSKQLSLTDSIYGLQDSILGLHELYHLTGNKKYLHLLDRHFKKFYKIAQLHQGLIPNTTIKKLDLALPWVSSNPAVAGLIAEHAYLSKNKTHHQLGDLLISAWLKTRLWQEQSLFHQGYNPYLRSFSIYKNTKIMKESSNMVYAMLQRPHKYTKEIKSFTNKLLQFQHSSGAFFAKWNLKDKKIIKDYFDKTQNFTIIDVLIEISLKTNQKNLIAIAEKCANFWIKKINLKTNLIPDYIKPNGKPLYQIAKLDQSADLYSSFLRLYSITDNKKYLNQALFGAKALNTHFGQSSWWHRVININTGQPAKDSDAPLNDRPTGRNLTKYIGGALRFYLSLYQVQSGKNMQGDKTLWLLSRDR